MIRKSIYLLMINSIIYSWNFLSALSSFLSLSISQKIGSPQARTTILSSPRRFSENKLKSIFLLWNSVKSIFLSDILWKVSKPVYYLNKFIFAFCKHMKIRDQFLSKFQFFWPDKVCKTYNPAREPKYFAEWYLLTSSSIQILKLKKGFMSWTLFGNKYYKIN